MQSEYTAAPADWANLHYRIFIVSTNQSFFKIILAWSASLWFIVLNLADSVQISMILKITVKYIFVVFYSPFFPLVFLIWEITFVVVCVPEIRTANIRRMLGLQWHSNFLFESHVDLDLDETFFIRSIMWLYRTLGTVIICAFVTDMTYILPR